MIRRLLEHVLPSAVQPHAPRKVICFYGPRQAGKTTLLRQVAFQIGSEVSLNELATALSMEVKTIDRYLGWMESAYVIQQIGGFSRNLRKEVARTRKIYFLDLGIRNAVLGDFRPLPLGDDVGRLWEHYLIVERRKRLTYAGENVRTWFWRTYDQQEIDYVEERGSELAAFACKWNPSGKRRIPPLFTRTYPHTHAETIPPETAAAFSLD